MSWDLRQLILGIHILLGIIWFGGILFIGWGVFPASQKLKVTVQREILFHLMSWIHWPLTFAGIGVITSGIIIGTVGGPIKTWDSLILTSYGRLFLTAFIIALLTLLWGVFIGYRHVIKVMSQNDLWYKAEKGDKHPLRKALMGVVLYESVEVSGLLAVLTCMILI